MITFPLHKSPVTKKEKAPFVGFDCSKAFKLKLKKANKSSGLKVSEFCRVAVEEWLARYPTPEARIAAVRAMREVIEQKKAAKAARVGTEKAAA